ncbi:MAG: hypothetical protein KAI81_05930 [Candidatus Marinimicrobia bacterium]|nr:hypothetical protein [Candidatus Neomarinimicrobiota bacterium]
MIGFDGDAEAFVNTLKSWKKGKGTLQSFKNDVEVDSNNVPALRTLAHRYIQRYEQEKSIPYYQRILELDKDNLNGFQEESQFYLAMNVLNTESDPSALEEFLLSAQDDLWNARGQNGLIRHYKSNGDQGKVLEMYEKLILNDGENSGLKNAYAWYIFEEKIESKYEHAIIEARLAVEIDPNAHSIWDTLAQLLFIADHKEAGISAMEKAVELEPNDNYYSSELKRFQKEIKQD